MRNILKDRGTQSYLVEAEHRAFWNGKQRNANCCKNLNVKTVTNLNTVTNPLNVKMFRQSTCIIKKLSAKCKIANVKIYTVANVKIMALHVYN